MRSPAEIARPLFVAACTVLASGVVAAAAAPRGASTPVTVAAASTDVRLGAPETATAVLTEIPAAVSSTTTAPAPTTTAPPTTAPTTTTVPPAPAPTAPGPAPEPVRVATVAAAQPAPAPTKAPPRPAASDPVGVDTACEGELFDRTNNARRSAGLAPLAFDSGAHSVSRAWSFHMAEVGRLSHNPRFGEDLTGVGVDWIVAGENVGRGSVAAIFQLWMDSPAHRANVLSPDYRSFAVACVPGGGQFWVTQNYWG